MSQSDYRDCVCMASRKLNLKFENLPLSVMYYSGGLVEGGGLVGKRRLGWNLINPPKNFKCILARDKVETVLFFFFFSKVIMRFYSFLSLVKLTAGPCRLDLSHSPPLLTYLGRNPVMNVYNTQSNRVNIGFINYRG